MIILTLLAGIWSTTCIQTQISNSNSGYVKEIYTFEKNGAFEFHREWYQDSNCTSPNGSDTESGTIVIGDKIDTFIISGEVYEADFNTQGGIDKGALTVKNQVLHVARGMKNGTMRNTMVGLFDYKKN